MTTDIHAKVAADVAEAKARFAARLATATPAELAAAEALRARVPHILRHAFMTPGNAKGRVQLIVLTPAQLLRWQGPI